MLRQLRQAAPADDRPGRLRLPGPAALPAALFLALLPAVSPAQQWLVTPEIEIAAQYVDNPRLRESGEEAPDPGQDGEGGTGNGAYDITGGLLDLALALRRNTPTSYFVMRPSVSIYRYSGDNQEDTESYLFDVDTGSEGQRSNWRLRGNYRQQQVYRGEVTSSEVDDIGVEDEVQTGSGRTFERRQRDLIRLQPGVTFELSQRLGLDLSANYLDVSYDTQEAGEAVDYTNGRADVGLIYQVAPQSALELGVFAERYEPDLVQRETDSIGAMVRYSLDVSDISGFFLEVGAQESDIKGAGPGGEDLSETAFLWGLGYERRFEVTRWRFEIGRNVTPSGSGAVVERDLLRVIMEHQFQPRWSLYLSGVAMNADTLGGEDVLSVNDRDYFQGRATLAFQATRSWSVEGLYAFTYQDFAHIEGDAQEHELRLSLVYRPPLPTQ